MAENQVPERRSIHDRMANLKNSPNPLVETDLNLLDATGTSTASFSIDETGELMVDALAPLALNFERVEPRSSLDITTASAYHLLLLPESVSPDDLEALAVSVWNEAGWQAPGVLRLLENVTLEGAWSLDEQTAESLGVPADNRQAWMLRCPPQRGAKPSEEVQRFDDWARAFPGGMPVGVEQKVLEVMRRFARRLGGSVRVAGSGVIVRANSDASVSLRVLTDQWLTPQETWDILSPHIEGLNFPGVPGVTGGTVPTSVEPGMPYAVMAPVSKSSQVLIGVRPETFVPRTLRWERWAKPPLVVYEIVWAAPEDLGPRRIAGPGMEQRRSLAATPQVPVSGPALRSRRVRLERLRAEAIAETAAAALATAVPNSAVIDEDGFLLALDAHLPEGGQPRP
ncbi:hypothetical protein [Actinomyces minihominis]|uniref:hypothetical protein n=1 Tax=Actinomyces minihominis TaxID=2002838 RepID=UPI000C06AA81|nr:hypothetical protein [Actinomyces minihominis]